jgi:hypothetical protein
MSSALDRSTFREDFERGSLPPAVVELRILRTLRETPWGRTVML